jgi:hypothetical protein
MAKQHDSARRPGEAKTKKCCKCGVRKPIDKFSIYKRPKTGVLYRRARCKKCINAYHVERRQRDPAAKKKKKHMDYVRANKAKLLAICDRARDVPCLDCGRRFNPWQMHFDHVRGKKVADVMYLAERGRKADMLEEMSKCEVVCACCHADRTQQRRGSASKRRLVSN